MCIQIPLKLCCFYKNAHRFLRWALGLDTEVFFEVFVEDHFVFFFGEAEVHEAFQLFRRFPHGEVGAEEEVIGAVMVDEIQRVVSGNEHQTAGSHHHGPLQTPLLVRLLPHGHHDSAHLQSPKPQKLAETKE